MIKKSLMTYNHRTGRKNKQKKNKINKKDPDGLKIQAINKQK
tara:strand:- start:657 stop:782 length:126 start_codon:yes stop_codon:yes gene_type:complete